MANYKGPTEGGSGGKRGHSSMEHWTYTDEIKESSKVQRRIDSKRQSKNGVDLALEEPSCNECGSRFYKTNSDYLALCPECAHWIYSAQACEHQFSNSRCTKCGWDSSVSQYVASLKTR